MKISFIAPAVGNSGGMQVIFKYAYELERRGHSVNVYVPIVPYVIKRMRRLNKICYVISRFLLNIYRFKIKKTPYLLCDYINWKEVLKISNYNIADADIVIATAWPTAFDVDRLNKSKGRKYYFVQDYEIWDDKEKGIESYKLNLNKIVIANWIKRKITELNVDTTLIPTIYNGIEYRLYNKVRKYNESEAFVFLMLDHQLEKKGVTYGISVFERIKEKHPLVKLKMFGMKKSKYVPNYVEYYENAPRDLICRLYNEADIFIFPSLEEGWGLTPIEAMAAGCAVVGTNTGCLLEMGQHRGNCMKSNPKDVEGMINNIEEVMKEPSLFNYLICNGKETAKQLDWENSVDLFETALVKEWQLT